ncbi:MAG TPA: hypothetical protein VE152_10585, partial [Acidimicrobiales bacterium]|nr:hypothetical protein [Acidimicrobiales bacterium]
MSDDRPDRPAGGISRRTFLARLSAAAALGAVGLGDAGCLGSTRAGGTPGSTTGPPGTEPKARLTRLPDGPVVATAGWV